MPKIPVKFLQMSGVGLVLLASAEGLRTTAYLDSVGVPTNGYGETKNVKLGDKTTPQKALVRLLESVDDEHGRGMKKCIGDEVTMFQKEYDWHLHFTYNIGVKGYCGSTTLKLLKEGKHEEACKAMALWNKPPEIRGRREKEVAGCLAAIKEGEDEF
jgi:lysozyme